MGANINDLVEELRDPCRALLDACSAAGLQPRITSTFRSHPEQQRLYRRFLAGQQGFPVAPPGTSAHEYGEAFDMVVTPMDALADVGYTWQTWGGGWGPGDAVHFELPGATASHVNDRLDAGPQIGATATSYITQATDFYLGSNVAGLLRMIPGLKESEALKVLSSPYESFQKWLISSIKLPGFR